MKSREKAPAARVVSAFAAFARAGRRNLFQGAKYFISTLYRLESLRNHCPRQYLRSRNIISLTPIHICLARMDESIENRGADGHTGLAEKGSISNMSLLFAKSVATLHSTMTKSFDDMKTSLVQLTVEEIYDAPLNIE